MNKAKLRIIGISKAFIFSLLGSLTLTLIAYAFGSCYISRFLSSNLTVVQITILAINIPTVGIILSNFSKVAKRNTKIWDTVRSSVLFSVAEQIAYIVLGVFFLIIGESLIGRSFSIYVIFALDVFQLSMLGMSLATMIDVFQSVISITEAMSTLNDVEDKPD